ncbi:hypothetical protein PDESU_00089 [Pontiella desulfatans]|uniref:Uncharacterized protein n=2 Tax=Pontiella desulfatans TaxID=2750659 RepID=A0A6C2TV93_PONDE|nr:hypothetical protein PDESU_00089 [Pontiella desulfatans]
MRPHPIVTGAMILILIMGFLLAMSFFSQEEGTGDFQRRGVLTLIVTAVLCICLAILATAKFWFKHLWKKNSTHARHKQHTKHHPAMREREFRRQRP